MTTEVEAFGSALAYDKNWDYKITETGSLDTNRGVDNLMNVLSAAIAREVSDYSTLKNIDALADVGIEARRAIRRDDRVERISSLRVSEVVDEDEINIEIDLITPADEVHDRIIL